MAGVNPRTAARALARRLAMQALYRWQLNPAPWQDVMQEFSADPDMPRADREYFQRLLQTVAGHSAELDERLAPLLDRKPRDLDPTEHAILWIALHELRVESELPFRVIINEAVSLARRFGATDSHKFINGVVDRAARELRTDEH